MPQSPSPIESILSPSGPVACALGSDYEARPQQLAMAKAVAHALAGKENLLVEAGTGVGKSFAYLAPAIDRILRKGERIVVATNTISLQEQLMEHDIPLLLQTLSPRDDTPPPAPASSPLLHWSGSVKAVLVKGRANYLSVRRLKLASQRQDKLFSDSSSRQSLHIIEDWAYETTDGTRSTLPQLPRASVWDRVRSDSGNCMGRKCPTYDRCFYQAARREMEQADLLICNHALFFSDLALRVQGVGFLPAYDAVILDEAHCVEDVAADHFGISLSEASVEHLLNMLVGQKSHTKGYLPQLGGLMGDQAAVEQAIELVQAARHACRRFYASLISLDRTSSVRNGRVRTPNAVENPLSPALNDLAIRLRHLRDETKNEQDRFELAGYALRATTIAHTVEAWLEQTAEHCVYWIEISTSLGYRHRSQPTQRVTIQASPVDVSPLLAEHLFDKPHSVILTSATLATRTISDDEPAERAETAFAHIINRLGCEGSKVLQLGSPFPYTNQVEVFIDRTMPSPTASRNARLSDPPTESYEDALASRISDHITATRGGAFVLFTSFYTLNQCADRLRHAFDELDYLLLCQGRDGSRRDILARFKEHPRAVLFGAASFWQGVDVRGDQLRNVIITRLPFEPPDRPLTEARIERIREQGRDPFKEDALPRAVIRFKQGFGRLIRSSTDTGRVVILDPRVITTGYGKQFLKALPHGVRVSIIHPHGIETSP